jgi:hypothetical protein
MRKGWSSAGEMYEKDVSTKELSTMQNAEKSEA